MTFHECPHCPPMDAQHEYDEPCPNNPEMLKALVSQQGEALTVAASLLDDRKVRITALEADLQEATELLRDITDPDHLNYCQTHSWLREGQCVNARARAFLARQAASPPPPVSEGTPTASEIAATYEAGR